jgi:hypothetical protein
MKKILIIFIALLCIFFSPVSNAQTKDEPVKDKWTSKQDLDMLNSTLAMNASQFGAKSPEKFILMQNRMGLRFEYCIDRSAIQIWISPQAGKSMLGTDRNFSNRDDHCNVFERITLSNVNFGDFIRCDYDPNHSVLIFKNQKVHFATAFDKPVILVWFEKDDVIDFKSGRLAKLKTQDDSNFVVEYTERGKTFDFAAVMGTGKGKFRHQTRLEDGRSVYARAEMAAGQVLAIGAELTTEGVTQFTQELANAPTEKFLADNEAKVNKALDFGKFTLRNRPEMQKLLDINKRIALNMQDEKGPMRSTNQYIYYLLWTRDGGLNSSHICMSGWSNPAKWQADIQIQNPVTSLEEPKGIFYGQLLSPIINKFEEDGLFYALWPAFLHWTQTGDEKFTKGIYMKNLEAAMEWLERYSYDKEKQLFYRYYYCEAPLVKSRDSGYDMATGAPSNYSNSDYKGDSIVKSYDIYINSLNASCYWMLSAMQTGDKAEEYAQKAKALEAKIKPMYDYPGALPSYGQLITADGRSVTAEPYAMDLTDYQWGLSLPPFKVSLHKKYIEVQNALYKTLRTDPKGMFLCGYNSILTSMDNEIFSEDSIMEALDYLVPQSVRPGTFLPMANTIPEIVDVEDGDPFHDVRPLVFSSAPWFSAVTNLGVRRLPFGIAARATKYLDKLENYEFRGALIDFSYKGEGKISKLLVNGKELKGTYQLPEALLKKGDNKVEVFLSAASKPQNVLVSSTLRLLSANGGTYNMEAYGKNSVCFRGLNKNITITDASGKAVVFTLTDSEGLTWADFEGRGVMNIRIK